MKFNRSLMAAVAAAAMLGLAPGASAAETVRATAPAEAESELGGQTITALLVVAGIIAAVLVVADDDDDQPVSV